MKKVFLGSLMLIAALAISHGARALTLSPPTSEITAKPGETVQVVAKLLNETNVSLTLKPGVFSFTAKNETGQPQFYDDSSGLDLQHWINVPDTVTLAPQERRSVIVTIDVPKTVDPGGHYAAIFWGTTPPKIEGSGAGVQGSIAMLILVNIEGNVKEEGKIIEFRPLRGLITHLPAEFMVRFENTGTIYVHPAGNIIIRNIFGAKADQPVPFNIQPSTGNVLPKSIRRFDLSWVKNVLDVSASEWTKEWHNFAFGRYTAEIDVAYGPSSKLATAKTSFWVFPWMILLVFAILIIIIVLILRTLITNYNRAIIRKYTQGRGKG
jgi:hypothetical protein